jgi:sec-independent protein translocase protein TatA
MGSDMGDAFAPWHIIILLVVFVLLFGARKLPDSARSLGQAMRIFKAETKGLHNDEDGKKDALPAQQPAAAVPAPAPTQAAAQPATQAAAQPAAQTAAQPAAQAAAQQDATQRQIQDLQRQLQDLQRQPAAEGTTVNGAPLSEAQPGQQPL